MVKCGRMGCAFRGRPKELDGVVDITRFQIEFLHRDAKQDTGLEDWRSTVSFGYNASLTAVNVARKIGDKIQ